MVLKTVYRRIRKSIPRLGGSKKQSTVTKTDKKMSRHASKEQNHVRDGVVDIHEEPNHEVEELREEYQELIRTSYRMVRCLGDDLDSSIGSSCVSGYRYREQAEEEILHRAWPGKGIPRTSNFVHQPIEVTHLLDDSDDEKFGLRFANMAAVGDAAMDDCESRESASVLINIDECRDTGAQCLVSPQREEDRDIYYRTNKRGYF